MTKTDLEKAFLEAAEIAKKLPKNLQEVGFNRALEQLLGKQPASAEGGQRTGAARKRTRRGKDSANEATGAKDVAWIDEIDRTAYPDISATSRVADRALKVLQLAHQDHGVDGLTASEIATILSRRFRLSTKANSVNKALDRETDKVDVRTGSGASRVFHIMAPGEAYLVKLRSGEVPVPQRKPASRREAKAASTPKSTEKGSVPVTKKATTAAVGKRASSRPGPKAAVGQLIQAGFFHTARTVSEIQQELRHRRGHSYSVQELSPALVRSIRDESLTRERNATGQYEYSQA